MEGINSQLWEEIGCKKCLNGYKVPIIYSYGHDTIRVNYTKFRVHSDNSDIKGASRSERPIVENVEKNMDIVESDRHVSTVSKY